MNAKALQLTTQSRQLVEAGSYAKAFDTYIRTIKTFPKVKFQLEQEFRLMLSKLNQTLNAHKNVENIFSNFERALDAYPGNVYLLNEIGKYLYKYGYYPEACCHFQKALKADPGYVAAEKNLNSVKNYLIERWHFRMLNDKLRNDSYHKAITHAIIPNKDLVLDIGSGTGLLSLFAMESSPASLTACDGSAIMTDIAKSVFEDNDKSMSLLLSKNSTDLNCKDIGGKRTVIITELFDAGLFGEHILETLDHAFDCLLAKNGRVIPESAEFFAVGAKCDFLNLKYQLSKSAKDILNISELTVHITSADPYDSEDVHLFKDITFMTEPQRVVTVDFNNAAQLKEMAKNNSAYEVNLKAKEDGEINVIIGWFNLHLSSDIMLTTNPTSKNRANAWQQAVFYDFVPISVAENDEVSLRFIISESKLSLIPEAEPIITEISGDIIRFLNDGDYMTKIASSIDPTCDYVEKLVEISELCMVDLSPFPYFGLLMMKRGAKSLFCYAKNEDDKNFFDKIFEKNNIPLSKITTLVGDELENEAFKELKFHVIYYNIIDVCGDLNVELNEVINHLKTANLASGGLLLPSKITLMGQIIKSDWLDINNRTKDSNMREYSISRYMNKYQVSENYYVDLEHLPREEISEAVEIGDVNTQLSPKEISVDIIKDGDANAIMCWYRFELMAGETITTKRPNSFADGLVFLAHPKVPVKEGQHGNILRCVDEDGGFKLVIDSANDLNFTTLDFNSTQPSNKI